MNARCHFQLILLFLAHKNLSALLSGTCSKFYCNYAMMEVFHDVKVSVSFGVLEICL